MKESCRRQNLYYILSHLSMAFISKKLFKALPQRMLPRVDTTSHFFNPREPDVKSSQPHCKNLVVLRHPREFNDMSPKIFNLGSVYTGPDPFGTGTKLVWISFVFTRDLVDLARIESAIWYQLGPLMKVILCGTVSLQFRTGPV